MQTRENYIQASFFSFLIHAIIFLYLVGFFYSEKQLRPILSQAVNVNIIVDTASEKILQKPNLNQISKSNPIENINIETKKSIDDIAKIDSEGSISNLKNLLTQESEILNSGDLENEINKYSGYMIGLIEAAWIKPKNIQDNLICDIKIKTNSRGRIINITLLKSSGNIRFDNSALQAVKRVETFPFFNEIKKTTYEDAFKNIVISFNPSK
mgnify:FL=1